MSRELVPYTGPGSSAQASSTPGRLLNPLDYDGYWVCCRCRNRYLFRKYTGDHPFQTLKSICNHVCCSTCTVGGAMESFRRPPNNEIRENGWMVIVPRETSSMRGTTYECNYGHICRACGLTQRARDVYDIDLGTSHLHTDYRQQMPWRREPNPSSAARTPTTPIGSYHTPSSAARSWDHKAVRFERSNCQGCRAEPSVNWFRFRIHNSTHFDLPMGAEFVRRGDGTVVVQLATQIQRTIGQIQGLSPISSGASSPTPTPSDAGQLTETGSARTRTHFQGERIRPQATTLTQLRSPTSARTPVQTSASTHRRSSSQPQSTQAQTRPSHTRTSSQPQATGYQQPSPSSSSRRRRDPNSGLEGRMQGLTIDTTVGQRRSSSETSPFQEFVRSAGPVDPARRARVSPGRSGSEAEQTSPEARRTHPRRGSDQQQNRPNTGRSERRRRSEPTQANPTTRSTERRPSAQEQISPISPTQRPLRRMSAHDQLSPIATRPERTRRRSGNQEPASPSTQRTLRRVSAQEQLSPMAARSARAAWPWLLENRETRDEDSEEEDA